MSEREYKLDVCPECKVREEDSSEKKLYQCKYCERWFCERHLEPRLAIFRDFKTTIKDSAWREIVEKERERKDGHPDYAYSWERLEELKIEKENIRAKMDAFLNKSRVYRKPIPRETEKEGRLYFVKEESPTSPSLDIKTRKTKTRKPFPTKKVVGLFLAVIVTGALLWYAPTIISTVQNLFSQSSYTKLTVVMGQIATYDQGDNHWVFSYRFSAYDPTDKFYVSTGFQTRVFSATEGATYKDLGIEIKVSEVHSDYIVLLVKPTY